MGQPVCARRAEQSHNQRLFWRFDEYSDQGTGDNSDRRARWKSGHGCSPVKDSCRLPRLDDWQCQAAAKVAFSSLSSTDWDAHIRTCPTVVTAAG